MSFVGHLSNEGFFKTLIFSFAPVYRTDITNGYVYCRGWAFLIDNELSYIILFHCVLHENKLSAA